MENPIIFIEEFLVRYVKKNQRGYTYKWCGFSYGFSISIVLCVPWLLDNVGMNTKEHVRIGDLPMLVPSQIRNSRILVDVDCNAWCSRQKPVNWEQKSKIPSGNQPLAMNKNSFLQRIYIVGTRTVVFFHAHIGLWDGKENSCLRGVRLSPSAFVKYHPEPLVQLLGSVGRGSLWNVMSRCPTLLVKFQNAWNNCEPKPSS